MNIGSVGFNSYMPYSTGYASAGIKGNSEDASDVKSILNPGESTEVQPGKKSSPAECETCKNRKYVDGSDEMVSFKSPAKVSPESAGVRVRAHEQEHVSNAYTKAAKGNGKVLQASVSIKTAVCPECGRSYVAGGTTSTKISYPKDKYGQNKKSLDSQALVGANFDKAV